MQLQKLLIKMINRHLFRHAQYTRHAWSLRTLNNSYTTVIPSALILLVPWENFNSNCISLMMVMLVIMGWLVYFPLSILLSSFTYLLTYKSILRLLPSIDHISIHIFRIDMNNMHRVPKCIEIRKCLIT